MEHIRNFVDGEHVEPVAGEFLDNLDPATGRVYSKVADSDEPDVARAVAAARKAFPGWSQTPIAQRSRILLKLADLVDANLDALARAECVDNGKPLRLARTLDIPRVASNFRFFGTAIVHAHSEFHATDDVAINFTLRKPRGVAGIISPWNLPLYLLSWKIAPAIATGNTVVAKPSEITPMTAQWLARLCNDAGLPSGVVNMVHGLGAKAGAAIVRHPDVSTISFTGSTVTGREIARTAAPLFKKVGLEMGGKNPNVIFADADWDDMMEGTVRSSFANQGQICLAGSRIFVERSVFSRFVNEFVARARALTVGDPLDEATDQGALVSRIQHEKVLRYVELARADGGMIHCGGGVPAHLPERCRGGYFVEPTVITGLTARCRVNQEEIFGPVVTVTPFDSEVEVIELANGTEYGLSASIWTRDISRANRLADRIESGTVWVNCWLVRDLRVPFGGMKSSGVGREGGEEALRFYTESKNVCIRVPQTE